MTLAFLGVHKRIIVEARCLTLDLYRSLLRSARQFKKPNQQKFLLDTIRERFRFHKHESSRPRVLALLREGNEALRILEETPSNTVYMERINAMVNAEIGPLKHSVERLRRIPDLKKRALAANDLRSRASKRRHHDKGSRIHGSDTVRALARIPESLSSCTHLEIEKPQKRTKMSKRKPYQIVKTVVTQGFSFNRLRGWRQPVKTAMMLKNRTKKLQQWTDQQQQIDSFLDILRHEQVFYDHLGIKEDQQEYAHSLLDARSHYKTLRLRRVAHHFENNGTTSA